MFCHWVGRLVRRLVGGRVFSSLLGAGWCLVGGKFLFSGESKSCTCFVRVGGLMKQSGASSF